MGLGGECLRATSNGSWLGDACRVNLNMVGAAGGQGFEHRRVEGILGSLPSLCCACS